MSNRLFLHWGPGGNTHFEKDYFQNSLPIFWWDQPFSNKNGSLNTYSYIVNSACDQINALLYESSKKKVDLIAHSFGGQIVLDIIKKVPDKIENIYLLGCSSSIDSGFLSLSKNLQSQGKATQDLKLLVSSIKLNNNIMEKESFWALISKLLEIPDFMDIYWGKNSKKIKEIYAKKSLETPSFNFEAFSKIVNDFFSARDLPSKFDTNSKVYFLYGKEDPLIDQDKDPSRWKTIFPNLIVKELNCGHFVHLETPSTDWLL